MPSRFGPLVRGRLWSLARRLAWGVVVLAGGLGVAAYGLLFVWPPTAAVETGATAAWPQVQPTAWRFSQTRTAAAVEENLGQWANWEACEIPTCTVPPTGTGAPEARIFAGVVRGAVPTLDLWLSIRVEANGDGGALIFARTETQNGRADFGQGARTLSRLWQDVAANLGGDVTFAGAR